MGIIKFSVAVLVVAVGITLLPKLLRSRLPVQVHGTVKPKFNKVKEIFRQNFLDGWEHEGAAFAVYINGELVIDLWGGYADESSHRAWSKDTLTTAFSSSKAMTSLCIAKLVDDGLMSYDDLVTKHWPEFGRNGKDNVTIAMLMSHEAGLAAISHPISREEVIDFDLQSKMFEDETPHWPPGRHWGYHALTHGWLANQLVRRVDSQKRSLGQYFKEEIQSKTGPESCYIGLPKEEWHRVARMSPAGFLDDVGHMFYSLDFTKFYFTLMFKMATTSNTLFSKVIGNPYWMLDPEGRIGFNNPDTYSMEVPAANGLCTARGLAQPFAALVNGKVLSQKTIDLIKKPRWVNTPDLVIDRPITQGYGFFHSTSHKGDALLGHPGYGGQNVKFDLKNKLALAYMTNGLKAGLGEQCRSQDRLVRALYDAL